MYGEKLIGKKIVDARENNNLSRTEFAQIMMVSVQAVGKWERGESLPDVITFKKIADVLGEDINFFLNNNEMTNHGAEMTKKKKYATEATNYAWDMSAANWIDADFSNLKGIADKFKYSNAINCKFCNSDLSGISFKMNNIKRCDFTNADFSCGKFSMSNMTDNNFKNCNFQNSIIKMCDIRGSDFSDADFSGTEINGTTLPKKIKGAKLNNTKFIKTIIENIVFEDNITDCLFVNCIYKKVEFRGVNFCNTFFKNHKMKKVVFINCKTDKITYSFLKNCKIDLTGLEIIDDNKE